MLNTEMAIAIRDAINNKLGKNTVSLADVFRMQIIPSSLTAYSATILALQDSNKTILVRLAFSNDSICLGEIKWITWQYIKEHSLIRVFFYINVKLMGNRILNCFQKGFPFC